MTIRRLPIIIAALVIACLCLSAANAEAPARRVLTIPAGTTLIEESAFENVPVDEIRLPDGITTIETRAFAGTGAQRVYLPDSLRSIGANAFDTGTVAYVYNWSGNDDATDTGRWWAQENGLPMLFMQEPDLEAESGGYDGGNEILELFEGTSVDMALRQWFYANPESTDVQSYIDDYEPGLDSVTVSAGARDYVSVQRDPQNPSRFVVTADYGAAQSDNMWERTTYDDAVTVTYTWRGRQRTRTFSLLVYKNTYVTPNEWSGEATVGVPALYGMHQYHVIGDDESVPAQDIFATGWRINGCDEWFEPDALSGDLVLDGVTVGRYYWGENYHANRLTIVWLREGTYTFEVHDDNYKDWTDTVVVTRDETITGAGIFWNEATDDPVRPMLEEGGDSSGFYAQLTWQDGHHWEACYVESVEIAPSAQGYIEAWVDDAGFGEGNHTIGVRALHGAAQEENIYVPSLYEDAVIVHMIGPDGPVTATVDVEVIHSTFVTQCDWSGEPSVGVPAKYSVHQLRSNPDTGWGDFVSDDFMANWTINGVEWYAADPDATSGDIVLSGVTVGRYYWDRAWDNELTIVWLREGTYTFTVNDDLATHILTDTAVVTRDSTIAGVDVYWNEISDPVTEVYVFENGEPQSFYGGIDRTDGTHWDACYVESVEVAPSAQGYINAWIENPDLDQDHNWINVTANQGAAQAEDVTLDTLYEDAVIVHLIGPDGPVTVTVDVKVLYATAGE